MNTVTLFPVVPALALSAPLGAVCAITAVAVAALSIYRLAQDRPVTSILPALIIPALTLIFVNPLIALAAQIILFSSFRRPEPLEIFWCQTESEVADFVNQFPLNEQRNWRTVRLFCPDLTSIPQGLFKNCPNLTRVDFSGCESLTAIPEDLFQGCTKLSEVDFSGCRKLVSLPENLFQGCTNLAWVDFSRCSMLASLPENLFRGCTKLSEVVFRACVVLASLPKNLFQGCAKLSKVDFRACNRLASIPEDLFQGCINLTRVDFSYCCHLASLPKNLFQGCINLAWVNFEECNMLASLSENLFQGCTKLAWVNFRGCFRLASFPENLFQGCTNLAEVNFEGCFNLTFLPENLFQGCTKLAWVDFSRCRALTGLPDSILNLPNTCSLDISGCSGLSDAILARLREATRAERYAGPRISFSVAEAHRSYTEKTIDACLRDIATISQETIAADVLKESGRGNLLQIWLNRISECADAKKTENQPYYRAVAGILNLASRDEAHRSNIFWPVLEQASQTCGDRVALSVLHFDIQRQIFEFDKRDIAGFADLLCRGVWALSILENLAREKVKTLRFFDEIETYLGYPIKLKEALNLPICLDAMLFPRCASLTDADLANAQAIVEGQLSSPEAKCDFLISQDTWIKALAESKWSDELGKLRGDFAELGGEDAYNNGLKNLTQKVLAAK